MEGLMGLINETVHSFNSEYNLGKETTKNLMTFCRPAVEKYVFSKVVFIYSFEFSFMTNYLQCMQLITKMKIDYSKKEVIKLKK